jgi:hypothetical protein
MKKLTFTPVGVARVFRMVAEESMMPTEAIDWLKTLADDLVEAAMSKQQEIDDKGLIARRMIEDRITFADDLSEALAEEMEKMCEADGHQWEDCSTADPDSGDTDTRCTRCGKVFHKVLY